MKFESFRLSDLAIKGEGNLHVVVLNERTGHVYRLPKECRSDETNQGNVAVIRGHLDKYKLYKIAVTYKKYISFQKFWGKDYLPKTWSFLIPKQIIEQIADYLEDQRLDSRKFKRIIIETKFIEIQSDLTRLPLEYNVFTNGITYCIELKTKFGILFQPSSNKPLDCRNKMSRFCIGQLKKTNDKTDYCPCDLFSGKSERMSRALKALIKNPLEKLRIFQDGHRVDIIDKRLINQIVEHLFQETHISEEESVEKFCDLIIEALKFDVSNKNCLLQVPFKVSTNCQAHSWSQAEDITDVPRVYSGSVLGRLISTGCLVDYKTEEIHEICNKFLTFLEENNITKCENIFDLWNEYLLPLDLSKETIEAVRMLKKYLVCLTVRDCSIMLKFSRANVDKLHVKHSNAAILKQSSGLAILNMNDVIDISIKPLSKIQFNFEYEQNLIKTFDN